MIKDNVRVIKFIYILFILLAIIFFSSCALLRNNKIINTINDFVKKDTKILYISNSNKHTPYSIETFEKYDINYLYINCNNLSEIEKISLHKFINKKDITNIVMLYKNGKYVDSVNYYSEDELYDFLNKYDLMPKVIGDNSSIINQISEYIKKDKSVLYLPYDLDNEVEKQNLLLQNLSYTYGIDYKKINVYLLSNVQKEKLNSLLGISVVEDQILLFIKNGNIIGNIRGNITKDEFVKKIDDISFIHDTKNKLTSINYDKFESILDSNNKSVVTIIKDDCKYCDDLLETFSDISNLYDVNIYYINVQNEETELSKRVKEYLNNLNYNDISTLPITLIIERNKVIAYTIGASSTNYFVDIFNENGIINKEVR